jgi:hypothetical protein
MTHTPVKTRRKFDETFKREADLPPFEDFNASGTHDFFQPLLARLVGLTRAPHSAATGGGFGFAPWENPGPRPPKAGAALSPTGQGKFRRDEQGCLVQKFVAAPHRLAPWSIAGYSMKFIH